MTKKRLAHTADTLSKMFGGWRLNLSKPNLENLGSGTLAIDVISGQCSFNDQTIQQLPIANELHLWFVDELKNNGVSVDLIKSATLLVELDLSRCPWDERSDKKQIYLSSGRAVKADWVNKCAIDCRAEILLDDKVYISQHQEVEEWPVGWAP